MEHNSRLVSRGGCQPAVFCLGRACLDHFLFQKWIPPLLVFSMVPAKEISRSQGRGAFAAGQKTVLAPIAIGGRVPPPFSFRHAERWGNFVPRARDVSGMPLPGDVSRPRARGPFGTAQKGRKGRLWAAAPKNPFDVQQSAIVSYRRVDIAFPLRPLPGLRPSRMGSQAISPLISRLLQRVTGTGRSPASLRRAISSKRNREATNLLS